MKRSVLLCIRLFLPVLVGAGIFGGCIKMPDGAKNARRTVDVTYRFEAGADMPALFSFYATYTGADGKAATQRIASLPWSQKVAVVPPFDARLKVRFEARGDVPEKQLYDVGFDGYITSSQVAPKSPQGLSAATRASSGEVLRLGVVYPDEATAQAAQLRIAPLKYDKHFAFTLTLDDSPTGAFSMIWSRIHAKWLDDKAHYHLGHPRTTGHVPAYPLVMTDGCGNDRRFGFSCALWSTWGNDYNKTFIKPLADTGDDSIYISWEELALLSDFGVSMLYHNVDERKCTDKDATSGRPSNPEQIAAGFVADYEEVLRRLGVEMKVMGLLDGNEAYLEAAAQSDRIEFVRNSLTRDKIYLNDRGSLFKAQTYGGESSQEVEAKLAELAAQAVAASPFWVSMTIHGPRAEHVEMLETIYGLYGKGGQDNLWAASWDEVYEYVALREGAQIARRLEGRTVIFEVTLPPCDGYLFRELTFLADGALELAEGTLSENIVGIASAPKGDALLVNVAFSERLTALAEKYTENYEADPTPEALDDARYFIGQLRPLLAEPFERRIASTVIPGASQVTPVGAKRYQERWNGYEFSVEKKIESGK